MKLLATFLCCLYFLSSGYSQVDSSGCVGAVGDAKWSVLRIEDFQQVNGNCWILMDGRNIASSKLGRMGFSNAPNGQGMFLRAIDMRTTNREDVDRPKGVTAGDPQNGKVGPHVHSHEDVYFMTDERRYEVSTEKPGSSKTKKSTVDEPYLNTGKNDRGFANYDFDNRYYIYFERETKNNDGSETRPKNIALYLYIRIN